MSRNRLRGQASQERQARGPAGGTNRIGIDTDVFELLTGAEQSEPEGTEPTIQRWLDCWRRH